MKKTQYLLLKKQPDGSVRLEAVTQSEWNETLSANRLPYVVTHVGQKPYEANSIGCVQSEMMARSFARYPKSQMKI